MKRQWWWNYLLPTNWLLPPPLTQFQSVRKKNRKQRPIYDIAQTICLREFFFFLAYSTLTLATTTPEPKRSASNKAKWFLLVFLYLVYMKISCFVKHWSCNKLIDLRLLLVCLCLIWNFHFKGWATPLHRLDKLHQKTWEINQNS